MKKLVCFGDSFIASEFWPSSLNPISIANHLQSKLNIPIVNYGVLGSSIEYSIIKFLEYTKSKVYDPDDIIIFIVTFENRFYNQELDIHVSTIGQVPTLINNYINYIRDTKRFDLTNTKIRSIYEKINYLEKNEKHIDWNFMRYNGLNNFDIESLTCLGLLNTWSSSNSNKIVVVNAFELDRQAWNHIKIFNQSDNFLPILLPGGLTEYSVNEFSNPDITSHDWKEECRVNHFSPENREVIADLLSMVIQQNDTTAFDTSLIKSKIHNNFKDILSAYQVDCTQYV